MSVFFNGRLWTTPAVMSVVDDSAMVNKNLTVGNIVAYIGRADGGQPNTVLKFGSPSEARRVLRSGELLEAVQRAFDASAQTNSPAKVYAVRVNPATQAQATVGVHTFKSTDYGLYTNRIKYKIESGTIEGKKLTTQLDNDYYTADNVARQVFTVRYTGAQATGAITVTDSTVTLEAPLNTVVATIDLAVYDTVQKLVDKINTVADFTATVLGGNGEHATVKGLDPLTDQDVKTATYTVRADIQAVIDWFNGLAEGFITVTRGDNPATTFSNLAWTYLSGGSDGTVTSTEWANALTALQAEDVQWVVPLTSDASIHAQADAHCVLMSNVLRMERRALSGGATGQSAAQAIAAAKLLNSDRFSLCYPGHYQYDASGALALKAPYMTAALVAAAFAGSNPGTPLTNKTLKCRGLEVKLRNPTDTDDLIEGGVLCVEDTPKGFKVVKSISTWLINDNYNRVEVSTGFAVDFVARNVRNALDDLRGAKATPAVLALAAARVESTLRELARPEPAGPEVITGNAESPAYKGIEVSLEGDVLRVAFQCSPVIPVNYIPVTIYAVPFSGTFTL